MKNLVLTIVLLHLCTAIIFANNIDSLKLEASKGNPSAQYELAIHYLNDENTNYIDVLQLLRQSTINGYHDAKNLLEELCSPGYEAWGDYNLIPQYTYGIISDSDKDFFLKWAKDGCGVADCKGHKGSFLIIAHSYFYENKYDKAIYYYKQALSQMKEGNLGKFQNEDIDLWQAWMDASTMIAYCYEHGYGVPKNLKQAIDYYFIGGFYLYLDEGNKYDTSNIKNILKEINNPELNDACLSYGDNYDGLSGSSFGARAWDKACILFLKSGNYKFADDLIFRELDLQDGWCYNNPIRLLWTGEMFYKGIGRKQQYETAYKYFNFIVYSDKFCLEVREDFPEIYADACYRLYECYAFGRGVSKNANMAEKFFNEALKYGSSSALYDDQKRYEITRN